MTRAIYRILVRLHPAWFRARHGVEMLDIFDQSRQRAWLLTDALRSLFTQRMLRAEPAAEAPLFHLIETPPAQRKVWLAGGLLSLLLLQALTWSVMHGGGSFPIAQLFQMEGALDRPRIAAHPEPMKFAEDDRPVPQRSNYPRTLAGRALWDWLQLVNAGNQAGLHRFFKSHLEDPGAASSNVSTWLRWHALFGKLELHTLDSSSEHAIVVRGKSASAAEWRIELVLNDRSPHRINKLIALPLD